MAPLWGYWSQYVPTVTRPKFAKSELWLFKTAIKWAFVNKIWYKIVLLQIFRPSLASENVAHTIQTYPLPPPPLPQGRPLQFWKFLFWGGEKVHLQVHFLPRTIQILHRFFNENVFKMLFYACCYPTGVFPFWLSNGVTSIYWHSLSYENMSHRNLNGQQHQNKWLYIIEFPRKFSIKKVVIHFCSFIGQPEMSWLASV